jgi:hypothetical protein
MRNMQLESILFGRAIRILRLAGAGRGRLYGVQLVRACETRYGFWQAPRTLEEFELSKGITFLHGHFQEGVVIDKFQIFENGLLVETKTNTDDCDAFLDDFIAWLREEININMAEEPTSQRLYYSNLEIRCSFSLSERFSELAEIGRHVAEMLRSYKQTSVDLELVGLSYAAGAGTAPMFRFERKEGSSEEARLYFCAAPLRTIDHTQIIEQLELALAN